MRQLLVLATCVLTSQMMLPWSYSQTELKDRVLEALAVSPGSAFAQFHAKCSLEFKLLKSDGSISKVSHPKFVLASAGPDFLLQRSDRDDGKPQTLQVKNEKYVFALSQTPQTNSVIFLGKNGTAEVQRQIENGLERSEALGAILSGVRMCGIPIAQFVTSSRFQLLGVQELEGTESPLVRIDFRYDYDDNEVHPFGLEASSFLCDPSKTWCILEYELNAVEGANKNKVRYRGKLSEIVVIDNVPFVGSLVIEETGSGKAVFSWRNEISQAVDLSHFYLSHYGFPEPNFGSRNYLLWILGGLTVGVGCLVVSRRLLQP